MMAIRAYAVVLVLILAACGDDSSGGADTAAEDQSPTTEAATSAATAAPGPPVAVQGMTRVSGIKDISGSAKAAITLSASEGGAGSAYGGSQFNPTLVKVDPGATIEVTVENNGKTDHNFAVESQKVDLTVASGKRAQVTVTMPKKDGLRFTCTLHPGMTGAFYSENGQTVQR